MVISEDVRFLYLDVQVYVWKRVLMVKSEEHQIH